jgi:exosome complex RNA-binding protein Csl4
MYLTLVSCHELGHIDGLGDYGKFNQDIVGEVQLVDTRTRQIEIRMDSGSTVKVRYDNNTYVVYRQRNYPVTNLEPGDYVAARVQQDRDAAYFTETVTVKEAQQERGNRASTRLDRASGRVEYIDPRRGTFELRDTRNRLIVVSIDNNAPGDVRDRFERLRNGDSVRIEGKFVGRERFELENFL